jgi:hypothetical protein
MVFVSDEGRLVQKDFLGRRSEHMQHVPDASVEPSCAQSGLINAARPSGGRLPWTAIIWSLSGPEQSKPVSARSIGPESMAVRHRMRHGSDDVPVSGGTLGWAR